MLIYAHGSRPRVLRMSTYCKEVMYWTLSGLRAVYTAIHVPYCILHVPYCKQSKIVIFLIFEIVNGYKTVTKTVTNVRYMSGHVQTYIGYVQCPVLYRKWRAPHTPKYAKSCLARQSRKIT